MSPRPRDIGLTALVRAARQRQALKPASRSREVSVVVARDAVHHGPDDLTRREGPDAGPLLARPQQDQSHERHGDEQAEWYGDQP
jgi:hypothetical protein